MVPYQTYLSSTPILHQISILVRPAIVSHTEPGSSLTLPFLSPSMTWIITDPCLFLFPFHDLYPDQRPECGNEGYQRY